MLKPQLNTPDKKLLLQASSRAKMDEWISVMRKAVVRVSEHPKFLFSPISCLAVSWFSFQSDKSHIVDAASL